MASSWGDSWGRSWLDSWGALEAVVRPAGASGQPAFNEEEEELLLFARVIIDLIDKEY